MRLIDHMVESPAICLCCGSNPSDIEGNPQMAIDLEVDVNWGDNASLCIECINLIGDLIERPPKAKIQKIVDQNKFLSQRNKDMAAEMAEMKESLDKIRAGAAEVKKVKAQKKEAVND